MVKVDRKSLNTTQRCDLMRKFLILLGVLAVIGLAGLWWQGTKAEQGKPAPGEIRIEVEDVV